MYLQVNFGALLAAVFLVLAQSEDVLAAPQAAKRAPNGMVTMPIRSLHKARSDVHPHVVSFPTSTSFIFADAPSPQPSIFNSTSTAPISEWLG